jgi:hypothetical protein
MRPPMSTAVTLRPKTLDMLRELAEPGETDEEIIRRLVLDARWKKLDTMYEKVVNEPQ